MRLCFPVEKNEGLESRVFGHFGSAPAFIVVETQTGAVAEVINRDHHHAHGACSPLRALDGQEVDAVVVGGIGGGAWMGLKRAGIEVLEAGAETLRENVALHERGALSPWNPDRSCAGHGHGHGGSHGHGCRG
ncbi:MAG: diguanylate cyclase [Deltaproteobacteria bacterium]|nr:diguanylate cyclase [Deltaproteobacteria bacterium]